MKNRMREIRTSGSVGDGDGNVPIYPATKRPLRIPCHFGRLATQFEDRLSPQPSIARHFDIAPFLVYRILR
jgi:hypothetical protein